MSLTRRALRGATYWFNHLVVAFGMGLKLANNPYVIITDISELVNNQYVTINDISELINNQYVITNDSSEVANNQYVILNDISKDSLSKFR